MAYEGLVEALVAPAVEIAAGVIDSVVKKASGTAVSLTDRVTQTVQHMPESTWAERCAPHAPAAIAEHHGASWASKAGRNAEHAVAQQTKRGWAQAEKLAETALTHVRV